MTNQYGVDTSELWNKAARSQVFRAVFSTIIADRNVCKVNVSGLEKWNYGSKENDWGRIEEGPRADGHYDVEGHAWTDIYATARLNLFDKIDLSSYLLGIKEWIKDIKSVWDWRNIGSTLVFAYDTMDVFSLNREYWIWTITSFDILKSDIVGDKLSALYGKRELRTIRDNYQEYRKKEQELLDRTSYEEVLTHVKENYLQINRYMWVQKDDPTCIYIDNSVAPYDMKSGWSNDQCCSFIRLWFYWIASDRISIVEQKNKGNPFRLLTRKIKMGLLDIKRGNITEYEFKDLDDGET